MKTNDSSHYSPLNPIWDLPYDPKGGSGIIEVEIFGDFWGEEMSIKRHVLYSWSDTVNGIEVDAEKPWMPCGFDPSSLEEDIYNAIRQEIKFDHINYILK